MTRKQLNIDELFDPAFLDSIKTLRYIARRVPPGGRHAEQRSRDLGSGIEFRDFRPYAAGDDLRSIDWNIYRRLGKVFLRLFEELEDLPLYVLTDISDSMWLEEPPRIVRALRTALALSAVSLNHHDSVGVFPFGADLSVLARPQAGKRRLLQLATRMASLEPAGPTDFTQAVKRLNAYKLRRGLCAVVSDFFDPRGIDAVLTALRRVRHKLVLVQLVRPADREPDLAGDLRLVDCETGEAQDISVTPAVVARYREAYARFQNALMDFASERGHGLVRVDVEQPVVPQLAQLFETGSLVV
ncbi:MAG: DUF58 domain-containing protein [Planctomycetota bacterium]|nr:DUF58 domain-containing protein [Planctomycetota bacterium]